ncbi:MAG TPA: BON domain-containing protein [Steroidobacteraceae bacterium]|nr:BON domain-containing protein [Steroidobacteraceae bacterium]
MRPRGLVAVTMMASLLLAGCVAAVIGHAPDSGTIADGRGRSGTSADAALGSAVQARIGAEPLLRHAPIAVSASGGTVTLRGAVASAAQRTAAERATRAVAGVIAVDNQLEVN